MVTEKRKFAPTPGTDVQLIVVSATVTVQDAAAYRDVAVAGPYATETGSPPTGPKEVPVNVISCDPVVAPIAVDTLEIAGDSYARVAVLARLD